MPVNLFQRISGSAVFLHKGQAFWFKDVGKLAIDQKKFEVMTDADGPIDQRRGAGRTIELTGTPAGVLTAAQAAVLYPYAQYQRGDLITPVRKIAGVTYGTGVINVPNHGFVSGTGVRIGLMASGATLPAGLALNTTYFAVVQDANNIKLSDTEQHAVAGTNLIAMTSNGTGSLGLVVNAPLVIWTVDGVKLTIWNAAVNTMPSVGLIATDTIFGQMKFEGFTRSGMSPSDANSLYTIEEASIPDSILPANPNQIPSVPWTIDWGTALPVTASSVDNHTLTVPNHGFATGAAVTLESEDDDGALPTGIAAATTYYAIAVEVNTLKLSDTQAHAIAGTNVIDFTDVGVGTYAVLSDVQIMGIEAREKIQVDFPVKFKDLSDGNNGIISRRIDRVDASVKFVPTNVALQDALNELGLQGAGTDLGSSLSAANMDIYGPDENPFFRLYGMALSAGEANFGSQEDRVGTLTFNSKRTNRGGVNNPIFSVGTEAPIS